MKIRIAVTLAIGLVAMTAWAQEQSRGSRDDGNRPSSPLMAALDVNTNGVLEAVEITNASIALLKLDINADGILTTDELQPAPDSRVKSIDKKHSATLMIALDANGDGILDVTEIANAGANLLKLDANGDGQLTKNELKSFRAPKSDDRDSKAGESDSSDHVGKPGENK